MKKLEKKFTFKRVKNLKTDQDFKIDLNTFKNSEKKIYLLELTYEYEEKLWGDIFWIIEDFKMRDNSKNSKSIVIVVNLKRYSQKTLPGILPPGWDIVMYEDLFGRSCSITDNFYETKDCDFTEKYIEKINTEIEFAVVLKKCFRSLNLIETQTKKLTII